MKIVDMHTHFLPKQWPDLAKKFGSSDWPFSVTHTEPSKFVHSDLISDKQEGEL